jgi:hypothetical protein
MKENGSHDTEFSLEFIVDLYATKGVPRLQALCLVFLDSFAVCEYFSGRNMSCVGKVS